MVNTKYLPTAIRYQTELAGNAAAMKAAGFEPDTRILSRVSKLVWDLQTELGQLASIRGHHAIADGLEAQAAHFCHKVLPQLTAVRQIVDALETVCPDETWPVPTYEEMLFIK